MTTGWRGVLRAASRRPAEVVVDLDALARNVGHLTAHVAPAEVHVVVKADGYGLGAVAVARAALDAGAAGLCVALVDEGLELRAARIEAPVLVLVEPPPDALADAARAGLAVTLYRDEGIDAAVEAAQGTGRRLEVHLKIDTGMHRVGADPIDALRLARRVAQSAELDLAGVFTHLAVADEPEDPFTDLQLDRFDAILAAMRAEGIEPGRVHAANSAGALVHPRSRYDLVRVGIAAYGELPSPSLSGVLPPGLLEPVASLIAEVHQVRRLGAGERTSYGRRYALTDDGLVATVPVGYADGVPRGLWERGEVLVGGRRRPIAGTVTMDQLIIDCGDDAPVSPGDEVVLIGRQGSEVIDAWEVAERSGTIAYEVLARLGPRLPRTYLGGRAEGP